MRDACRLLLLYAVTALLLAATVRHAWGLTATPTFTNTPTAQPSPSPACSPAANTATPANTPTFTPTMVCPTFFTPPIGTPTNTPTPPGTCGPTIAEVNTLDEHDDGCCDATDCTLVEAVHGNATDGATITFKTGLTGTLLQHLLVHIPKAESIIGHAGITVRSGAWQYDEQIPTPTPGWTPVPVTVSNLTMECGGFNPQGCGFIQVNNAFMCLTSSHNSFLNNTATDAGGAINVPFDECFFVDNSEFRENTATNSGGALSINVEQNWQITTSSFVHNQVATNVAGGGAMAFGFTGTGNITTSSFLANTSGGGGGAALLVDGFFSGPNPTTTITDSSFLTNTAVTSGGALSAASVGLTVQRNTFARNTVDVSGDQKGSAILSSTNGATSGATLFTNNTLEGNACVGTCTSAFSSGAMQLEDAGTTYTLYYNTLADNDGGPSSNGGALTFQNNNVTLNSNLFSNNIPFACSNDGFVTATSTGSNINTDNTCNLYASTDMPNTDARLYPLGPNGGPTDTMPIDACSPAYNTADVVTMPATDQRGVTRPQSTGPDRGAYELGVGGTATPTPTITATATMASTFTATVTPTITETPTITSTPTAFYRPTATPTLVCYECPGANCQLGPTPGCTPVIGARCIGQTPRAPTPTGTPAPTRTNTSFIFRTWTPTPTRTPHP